MNTKMIVIPHNGPIYAKSGVYGPISTPYREDCGTIFRMISEGVKVVEVLNNGKELPLDIKNFDKDNNEVIESVKPVQITPVENEQPSFKNGVNPPIDVIGQQPLIDVNPANSQTPEVKPQTTETNTQTKPQQNQTTFVNNKNHGKNKSIVVPDATEDK